MAQSKEVNQEAVQMKQLLDKAISDSYGDMAISEKEKRFVARIDSLKMENDRLKAELAKGFTAQAEVRKAEPKTQANYPVKLILFFESMSASLDNQDKWLIRKWLNESKPERINLAGFTDAYGKSSFNKDLAKKRTEAVVAYLKSLGFSGELILDIKGPLPEATGADASPGRRVELTAS